MNKNIILLGVCVVLLLMLGVRFMFMPEPSAPVSAPVLQKSVLSSPAVEDLKAQEFLGVMPGETPTVSAPGAAAVSKEKKSIFGPRLPVSLSQQRAPAVSGDYTPRGGEWK